MFPGHYKELPDYERLEDVPLPDIHIHRPYGGIDEGITNLARALCSIRIEAHSLCEGHLDHGIPYPWIGINPFAFTKVTALNYLLEQYSLDHEEKWVVETNTLLPSAFKEMELACASNNEPEKLEGRLRELQQSANELAQYIFDNRQDEKIRRLILVHGW